MVAVQEAPKPPPTGQLPKSIDVQDVLMQDVVAAQGVPVARDCGRPIAPFRNPHKGRVWDPIRQEWVEQWRIEALVLSGDESGAREVVHLVNDPSEAHGWRTRPVFAGYSPHQIAVLRDSQGLFCVMIVAGKLLWSALGSDDAWAAPSEFGKAGNTCLSLQVSYVHGRPFIVVSRRDMSRYCLFGERGAWKESPAPAGANDSGLSVVPQGYEGHDQVVSAFVTPSQRKQIQFRWAPFGNELPLGDKFLDVDKEVHSVLAARGQVFLLLNADGTLATFRGELTKHPDDMTIRQMDHKVATDCRFHRVVTRISHEKAGQFWDIYALDTARRLWIIRQDRSEPTSPEGHPRFCPPVPVDTGVGGMDVSHDLYEESLIFSYAAKDRRLRLEAQDPRTRMWREIDVLPPTGATLLEKTVHRVEAVVRDQRGAPIPYTEIAVSSPEGAADCEIYWKDPRPGGKQPHPQMLTVTQGGVTLHSDLSGRVVFTLAADGLVARELLLKAGAGAVTHARPGAKVLTYLKGSGTLRETDPRGPLPEFDENGEALKHLNPQAEGETRKHAAYWMRQAAAAGLRSQPQGIVAVAAPQGRTGEAPEGWWGSFTHWAGDVWRSVSRGIATAANWVVQESKLVLDGVKWLGEEFVKGGKLVVAGMQQACHVVVTLFEKIVDTAEKALHWLQATLDFRAMWHTKCAFTAGMDLAFGQAQQRVTGIKQASDTWLDSKRDELRQRVKQAQNHYRTVPLSTGTGQGSAGGKLRERTQDPTASWLYDKVQVAPPGEPALGGHPALETAWNDFRQNLDRFTEDGKKVGGDLVKIGGELITTPSSDRTVGDLLGLVGDIENTLLDVVKGFVDGVADLVNVGLSALHDVLKAELPVPDTLKTLWAWMVTAGGGNPASEPLNLANLIALLAAVPVTVVYKLANGNAEPFPNGRLPELNVLEGPDGSEAAKVCLFVSGILTAVSVLPAITSDAMGTDAPVWVSAGSLVLSVLTITLANYTFLKGAAEKLSDPVAAICAAHLVEFVACVVLVSLSRIRSASRLAKKFMPLLTTALGLLGLLYYGYKAGKEAFPNVGTAVAGGLAALSPCTAFLNFETFRNSEYALPAKLFLDPLGLVGSGTLVAVNASPLAGN